MTPHNNAKLGDIAKNVLMPGDPLRAKFIAETFLKDVRQVNTVRNMFAFTGTYKGKEITVMGSGMGMASIGIYSYELFKFYGVENIIRVGSAGAYIDSLDLYDVVLANSAWSQSTFARTQNGYNEDTEYPSEALNEKIKKAAGKLNIPLHLEKLHSSDVFYTESNVDGYKEISEKYGCACVEMESFALFHNAKVLGKNAACLLTISDSFTSQKQTTAEERQTAFTKMIEIALETFVD
ncbi:Purine nucleoside phosphorylase DeoD-type [Fusobacterium sp. DD29]|nr:MULTISPECIES: purine-nucleoside phosphorylase [unclassified Fusobacterium]MBR8700976.1 Purine nucleoside phosphorylase DeoD-type [Fusobacterium sp. DD45]MBR8710836.1 Purine nucleoside phosphorylase DeoD-type [Fusobacterium sp. DD28]MBR8748491.1 Purine nucleoside phosphorylase DeoD-type [Fusobacterium sp. DD29]MBR8751311.1 Purine nucleoside phosphorylase DeoD-type [Fusobacterium sp. DD26]MBR8760758.1 Purine nucleoside phosphorylase DeoD-type [Fusobacterium sp. DD25]